MTILYSALHLLVDGVCALAMFGGFLSGEGGYFYILVYNFCAFALQMPFGALLDVLNAPCPGKENGRRDPAFFVALAGILFTIAGAFTHPAVLGIGNALFHVGGGVGCIREDRARHWRGRGLGVFVAPGALGLYLGTLIAKGGPWKIWVWGMSVLMLFLCLGAIYSQKLWSGVQGKYGECGSRGNRNQGFKRETESPGNKNQAPRLQEEGFQGERNQEFSKPGNSRCKAAAALLCLGVVVLRSWIGMTVSFPWKSGILAGILAVAALAGGKTAGGFAGARYGFRKTAAISLLLAAFFYFFSHFMPMGLAALFFFNMTMPITLYWMVCIFPKMPGFAFGLLTFALFLGFLPGYFGLQPVWDGRITGGGGSLVSLLLLAAALGKGGGCESLSD